jgi:hypothetical protein
MANDAKKPIDQCARAAGYWVYYYTGSVFRPESKFTVNKTGSIMLYDCMLGLFMVIFYVL